MLGENIVTHSFFNHAGVNCIHSPQNIPDNKVRYMTSMHLKGGVFRKRNGYVAQSTWSGDTTGDIYDMYHYEESDGSSWVCVMGDHSSAAKFQYWDSSWKSLSNVASTSTLGRTSAFWGNLNNTLIYTPFDNTKKLYEFDGTTAAEQTSSPACSGFVIHQNRAFTFDTSGARSRVEYSDLNDPDAGYSGSSQYFDVSVDDGNYCRGLCSFQDERLLIFKDSSIWELLGSTTYDFTIKNITKSFGCVSAKSICRGMFRGQPVCFFLGNDGSPYAYNGFQFFDLGESFSGKRLNTSAPYLKMIYDHATHRLWVLYNYLLAYDPSPLAAADGIFQCCDLDTLTWSNQPRYVAMAPYYDATNPDEVTMMTTLPTTRTVATEQRRIYFAYTFANDSAAFKDTDSDDTDYDITVRLMSKEYTLGDPYEEKNFLYLIFFGDFGSASSNDFTLDIWVDGTKSNDFVSDADTYKNSPWVIPIKKLGKTFQFDLQIAGQEDIVIDGWQILADHIGRPGGP